MRKLLVIISLVLPVIGFLGMTEDNGSSLYKDLYYSRLSELQQKQNELISLAGNRNNISEIDIDLIKQKIREARQKLKAADFWLRYLEPVAYKKINGPLPVEWETEVFEKFEKPYKRVGAGLTLAEMYMDEAAPLRDSLLELLTESDKAIQTFRADSVTRNLGKPGHLFFANRLFLLNLSAIYTTGFECPDADRIIPELEDMLLSVKEIYLSFNQDFPATPVPEHYLKQFDKMVAFVNAQSKDPVRFSHYDFIKDHVNPLFALNQQLINSYGIYPNSYNDFSLNNNSSSIFSKDLYSGQNSKGIYIAVDDEAMLNEIKAVGKLLFFDPILSGNGKRSCASCHKPDQYFNDTTAATSPAFNEVKKLPRNTPTLLNAVHNHLLMLDGKHISLQDQAKGVITNPDEMGCDEKKVLENILSCVTYRKAFTRFKKLTPFYPELTMNHIVSAITLYYSDFSNQKSPFDNAMNGEKTIPPDAIEGFNLFMSKAQCATCHFVPVFNGVKPPYIGSEFEVIGVPSDTTFKSLSRDSGRYIINPAGETMHAFRTGSIRNSGYTMPYMHNGVFRTMDEVIDFYNAGGGAGKKLIVNNQTLSPDSLGLTKKEIAALKAFIKTLDEEVVLPSAPSSLPYSKLKQYNFRKPGGEY